MCEHSNFKSIERTTLMNVTTLRLLSKSKLPFINWSLGLKTMFIKIFPETVS